MGNRKLEIVLRRGMKFIPDLIESHCGNCEGTPCDDMNRRYICRGHKWLKEVRALLKGK